MRFILISFLILEISVLSFVDNFNILWPNDNFVFLVHLTLDIITRNARS